MSEHSEFFEKAKDYYERGLWSKAQLRALVTKGKLTAGEYEEITGEQY